AGPVLPAEPERAVGDDQGTADHAPADAAAGRAHLDPLPGRSGGGEVSQQHADRLSFARRLALRILAVDPGSKRVGLALSDPTAPIAHALPTLAAEPAGTLAARIVAVAKANEAARIVVGLPKRL